MWGIRSLKTFLLALVYGGGLTLTLQGQNTQPIVAIHDSELTRALESMTASGSTLSGAGTTGFQWWPSDWHYFVMPESLKEAMRSDGTAFAVVSDANITAGLLLTNGRPQYPIVISLASEAIRDNEIAPLTNYVAAGGFLLIGSSAFTRYTDGSPRGDFAFADQMGIHTVSSSLDNWRANNYFSKRADHRLVDHIPSGTLTWRMPTEAEEISWGTSPSHPFLASHATWQVRSSSATVLANGDGTPYLLVRPFGKGCFIYYAAFQPLIGHGGFAPSMYAYVIFRKAIEWAFESASLPVPRLSPWPYAYDAAFMIRHDLENDQALIANIEASAQFEYARGAKGDYYFCTGTLREDMAGSYNTAAVIQSLRRAVANYEALIGQHNGGLKNPNNPSLAHGDYDYWHWGPDEALDVTPAGYSSGKAYAQASLLSAFQDMESWLSGLTSGTRAWVSPYFNATREDSYDLQNQLKVRITGDQKLTPFPHWTLSTRTAGKRYACLSEPVSDWFVGGLVAQSLEPWHPPGVQTVQTLHDAIDFYYDLGALINFYSHSLSTGQGDAGQLASEYVTYSMNSALHPRLWAGNAEDIYQWWLQRSNAQISVSYYTNGLLSVLRVGISGAKDSGTALEFLLPDTSEELRVMTNNVLAGGSSYRVNGQLVKVRVGTSVTNVIVACYPPGQSTQVFAEDFDGVTAPGLPSGWTTMASGAQSPWVTQSSVRDTLPNAAFVTDAANVGVSDLVSPLIALPQGQFQLWFQSYYNLEADSGTVGYDGGVLEIKVGSGSFTDLVAAGGNFMSGAYTHTISSAYSSPLAGRPAWSGNSGGFFTSIVDLPASAAGQTVQLRWRCATDDGKGDSGWRIDSITITNYAGFPVNHRPVLPAPASVTLNELTQLRVTNTATDEDLPAQSLSYQLLSVPTGATINSQGVVTWTPTEAQGPGTNLIRTVVTDDGVPPLSATNLFTVVVKEVNAAPVLPVQANRTINELTTLRITNTATDMDLPANALTYTLLAGPTNATLSSQGVITWTPGEEQGGGTNTFVMRVMDNGAPALGTTNSFDVVVAEVNSAPVLPVQTERVMPPLTLLVVTNTATDADYPVNPLTYSLVSAPAGAVIDAQGVITWTPTLAQNNTTNLFTTTVTDSNRWAITAQQLRATNSFTVVVNLLQKILADGTTLIAEACQPANNAIDPSETVTLLFGLKNAGTANATNLVARLLATNGVVLPSVSQNYGAILAGGATASRPFTFTAQGPCGGSVTATLQLQDGGLDLGTISVSLPLGKNATILAESFDAVTAPALPPGWGSSASGAQSVWVTQSSVRDTAPNSAFSADPSNVGINELVSPSILLPAGPSQLSFRHNYNLETGSGTNGYDGGVLEVKIGSGGFTDIRTAGGSFASGGYNKTIDIGFHNPLAGRPAWSGDSGGFITTVVNLPAASAGQVVQFRWRCGTDDGGPSGTGWRLDSLTLNGQACCLGPLPTIQSISLSGSALTLGCSAAVWRSYRLQYKDSLAQTNWTDQVPDFQASAPMLWITNFVSTPQRFYRVVLLP